MRKMNVAIIIALCLSIAFIPTVSHAAVSPHFVAVNDTLLTFSDSTMPYVSGGVILVPYEILSIVGIWSLSSAGFDYVQLYRGSTQVNFYAERGVTEDQYGNVLAWPTTQRARGKFYVPLIQVCDYFGMSCEIIEVGRDVIPNRQIWLIRIISGAALSSSDFIARYRSEMLSAYNEYYGFSQPASPTPSEASPSPPVEEPPPDYSDVTVYLSFNDVTAGGAGGVLEMLDAWGDS